MQVKQLPGWLLSPLALSSLWVLGCSSTPLAAGDLQVLSAQWQAFPAVQRQVKALVGPWKKSTEATLGRGAYYFPLFEEQFKAAGLPLELKYLAAIESELLPRVRSRQGATGLWQFMPATARHYGLRMNSWLDERRDPLASTQAAVRLLQDLQRKFGDWPLVLAAYNCGEGRLRQAIRRAGSRQFGLLSAHLPRQTRRYLVKFFAMMQVAEQATTLGLIPQTPGFLAQPVEVVTALGGVKLHELARQRGCPLAQLQALNPALLKGITPLDSLLQRLVLPVSAPPLPPLPRDTQLLVGDKKPQRWLAGWL